MTPTLNAKLWSESMKCSKSLLGSSLLFPLLLVHFATFAISQGSIYFQQYRMANPKHDDMSTVITLGLVGIFLFLVLSILWIMLTAKLTYDFKKIKNLNFYFDINQTSIEYMRSLVTSLCYGLFFLIPGIYKFIQLSFSSFVSMFDDEYDDNKVDALKKSAELVRNRFWPLLLILILKIFIGLIIESTLTHSGTLIDQNPFGVILNQFLQFIVGLIFSIYLVLLFFEITRAEKRKLA